MCYDHQPFLISTQPLYMKRSSLKKIVAAGFAALTLGANAVFAFPVQISIPQPDMGAFELMKISCKLGASVAYVDSTHNNVTYWLEYNNSGKAANHSYSLQAATENGMIANASGVRFVSTGTGKILLPNGARTATVKVVTSGATKVNLQGKIEGITCTPKQVALIKVSPLINPIIKPLDIKLDGAVSTTPATNVAADVELVQGAGVGDAPLSSDSGANNDGGAVVNNNDAAMDSSVVNSAANSANDSNANGAEGAVNEQATCKVVTDGSLQNNKLSIGAALQVFGYADGAYNYQLRGYSESSPNDIREYNGTFEAKGDGFILNNGKGFLFELPLVDHPLTYTISGTVGSKTCTLVSYAAPASVQNESAVNQNSSVQVFGQTPDDTASAQSLKLVSNASADGAQAAGASNGTMYIMYALIAALGGLIGYIVYLQRIKRLGN